MATTPYGNTCAWDTSPNAPSPIFLLSSTSSRLSLTTPCSSALEPGEGWEGGPGESKRRAKVMSGYASEVIEKIVVV